MAKPPQKWYNVLANSHKNATVKEYRHMYSIPENIDLEQSVFSHILPFFRGFRIESALRNAGAFKVRGIPVINILAYIVNLVYSGKTMHREMNGKAYSKTVYRFLADTGVNWNKFLLSVSSRVILFMKQLTSEERLCAIVVDDTMYLRSYSKKTELVSKCYDHTDGKYKCGFRSLFLAWTDGSSLIPLCFRHMAASTEKYIYRGISKNTDGRTCAGRAKNEALKKSTDIMLSLLKHAESFDIPAGHVLFDSWFSFPSVIAGVRDMGYHVVCRLKNAKTYYKVDGKNKTLKQIFDSNKKRRGKSRYLLSVSAELIYGNHEPISVRIVYVRNRNKRNEYIAFLSTDSNLNEDEVIALYGKRWSIEVFFKTCKSYLRFTGEFRQTRYESITAHTSVVALRYIMLAFEQRRETDNRTMGALFYRMSDEAKDITFQESLAVIFECFLQSVTSEEAGLDEEQILRLIDIFVKSLPSRIRSKLLPDSEPKQPAA
jgi:hypothetical protein